LGSEECAREGWDDEPVEFSAYQNLNCDIQVWAYRSVWAAEVAMTQIHHVRLVRTYLHCTL